MEKNLVEDYCSYELAKLLKEKGFDEICTLAYEELNQLKVMMNWRVASGYLPCPTHQMAMKWLREVHGLHISIGYYDDWDEDADGNKVGSWYSWDFEIYYLPSRKQVDVMADHQFDTYEQYEQAVEAALKYALEYLI